MYAGRLHHWRRYFSTGRQSTQQEGPDISLLEPALQKQWDHAANAHLGNMVIKSYSQKEVWWTCDQCPGGYLHRWTARVANRIQGSECPQCCGRKVCKHNSLATKAPEVAAQWDHVRNDGTSNDVVANSARVVGWLCDVCGHKWRTTPNARVSMKRGCPQCAEVARTKHTRRPTFAECQDPEVRALLAQWDHRRNADENNFPHNTRLRSHKQIWWFCTSCAAKQKHSWSTTASDRTARKLGCPVCAGRAACRCNSLQTLYPDTAAEWDHEKNKRLPSDYPASSHCLVWWSSTQRGNWQQTINSRTNGVYHRIGRLRRIQQRQTSDIGSADLKDCAER